MSLSLRRRTRGSALAAGALALLVVVVTACSSQSGDSATSGSGDSAAWAADLVNPGKLTIATSGNTVPYAYPEGDKIVGYSMDQCNELAKRMGLEPKIEVVEFSGVMTGIQSGKFDVACSGELVQTEERKAATGFYLSTPTLMADTGLLGRASEATSDNSFDIARGKKVGGVQGAASPGQLQKELNDDVEIVLFPGVAEAVTGLKQNRVDYYAATTLVLQYYAAHDSELKVVATGLDPTPGGLIISRHEGLRDEINKVSQEMLDDGTIADMQKKWFNTTSLP